MSKLDRIAHVGNPVDLNAVPKHARPNFTALTQVATPAEDRRHVGQLLRWTIFCSLWSAGLIFWANTTLRLDPTLLPYAVTGLVVGAFWLRSKCFDSPLPIVVYVAFAYALAVINVRVLPGIALVVGAFALLVFAVLVHHHYVSLCMRSGLARYLDSSTVEPAPRLAAFVDLCISFLSYGRHGEGLPGMARSPAGTYRTRICLSVVVLLLVSYAIHRLCFGLLATGIHRAITVEALIEVGLLATVFCIPLPIVLLACFVISYPILGRAYACKLAANRPEALAECFYPILDDFNAATEKAQYDSIPWGHIVYDNTPIFFDFPPGHIWITGLSGSGKTAWILRQIETTFYRGACEYVSRNLTDAD